MGNSQNIRAPIEHRRFLFLRSHIEQALYDSQGGIYSMLIRHQSSMITA